VKVAVSVGWGVREGVGVSLGVGVNVQVGVMLAVIVGVKVGKRVGIIRAGVLLLSGVAVEVAVKLSEDVSVG